MVVVFPGGDEGWSSGGPTSPRVFGNPRSTRLDDHFRLAALRRALLCRCGVHHRVPLSVPSNFLPLTVHGNQTTGARRWFFLAVRPHSETRAPVHQTGRAVMRPPHRRIGLSEVRTHGTGMASVHLDWRGSVRASTSTRERRRPHVVDLWLRLHALICSHPVERPTQHIRAGLPRGLTEAARPLIWGQCVIGSVGRSGICLPTRGPPTGGKKRASGAAARSAVIGWREAV